MSMENAQKQRVQRLENILKSRAFSNPLETLIEQRSENLSDLIRRAGGAVRQNMENAIVRCEHLMRLLNSLNPGNIKKRGYAVVKRDGRVLSSIELIEMNDHLRIEMADGGFEADVSKRWRMET